MLTEQYLFCQVFSLIKEGHSKGGRMMIPDASVFSVGNTDKKVDGFVSTVSGWDRFGSIYDT